MPVSCFIHLFRSLLSFFYYYKYKLMQWIDGYQPKRLPRFRIRRRAKTNELSGTDGSVASYSDIAKNPPPPPKKIRSREPSVENLKQIYEKYDEVPEARIPLLPFEVKPIRHSLRDSSNLVHDVYWQLAVARIQAFLGGEISTFSQQNYNCATYLI